MSKKNDEIVKLLEKSFDLKGYLTEDEISKLENIKDEKRKNGNATAAAKNAERLIWYNNGCPLCSDFDRKLEKIFSMDY